MARPHKIQIVERNGKIYARITYSVGGKRKEIWRSGSTRTEARDRLREELRQRESLTVGGRFNPGSKLSTVIDWYLDRYAVAPVYSDDQKVAGLRSGDAIRNLALPVKAVIGDRAIGAIQHSDLELFKQDRLRTPTRRLKDAKGNNIGARSLASVHRELALLRRVFNIAEREGWLAKSPFRRGESLISQAQERKGTRVLSKAEEAALLAACVGQREHLRAIVICALDTGMRRGEILSLKWSHVDLDNRRITLAALNTKTLRSRIVPIGDRLLAELLSLKAHTLDDSVFGITEVKRSFTTACRIAKLERGNDGMSFRALRRTAATRWLQAGLPRESVSKLLGHATAQITYQHYLAADENTLRHAEELVNQINQTAPSEHSTQNSLELRQSGKKQ